MHRVHSESINCSDGWKTVVDWRDVTQCRASSNWSLMVGTMQFCAISGHRSAAARTHTLGAVHDSRCHAAAAAGHI